MRNRSTLGRPYTDLTLWGFPIHYSLQTLKEQMDLVPLHTCLLSEWPQELDPCHIFNKEKPSKAYWKVVFFAVAVLGNELKAPRMSGKLTTTGAEFIPTLESCVLNVSIALCLPRLRYLRFVQAILFLFTFFRLLWSYFRLCRPFSAALSPFRASMRFPGRCWRLLPSLFLSLLSF